jgi:hypothetical protein
VLALQSQRHHSAPEMEGEKQSSRTSRVQIDTGLRLCGAPVAGIPKYGHDLDLFFFGHYDSPLSGQPRKP